MNMHHLPGKWIKSASYFFYTSKAKFSTLLFFASKAVARMPSQNRLYINIHP